MVIADFDVYVADGLTGTILTTAPVRIGSRIVGTPNTFNGYIDQTGIWKRILNQTDVNNLWNNGNGLEYINW